jgi:hypothetical protein
MPAGCSLTDAGRACLPSAPPRRKPKPARPSSLPPFHRSAPLPASHGVGLLQLLRQLLRRLLRLCGGNGEANRRRAGDACRVVDVAALDADLVRRARRTVRGRCGGEALGQVRAQRACVAFLFTGASPRRRWGASARTRLSLAARAATHAPATSSTGTPSSRTLQWCARERGSLQTPQVVEARNGPGGDGTGPAGSIEVRASRFQQSHA